MTRTVFVMAWLTVACGRSELLVSGGPSTSPAISDGTAAPSQGTSKPNKPTQPPPDNPPETPETPNAPETPVEPEQPVVEVLTQPVLVRTFDTSKWPNPSPDPSDVFVLANGAGLLIPDGEVDETPLYKNASLFIASMTGAQTSSYRVTHLSHEPTGITVHPQTGHWFMSDDDQKRIFEIALGSDGVFGTADDVVTSFSTSSFGDADPEGLTFGPDALYITDGLNSEVYTIKPGADGRYTGSGDDVVTHFDSAVFGQPDPEGIAYFAPTSSLYVVSNNKEAGITEISPTGTLVRKLDISFLGAHSVAGIAVLPHPSRTDALRVFLADRGLDNNPYPDENDGKIYELLIPAH